MRNYKTIGIIIKRTNFSEADRILTIFTRSHGKIKVIAKGVRRITSRRCGNVELLNLAEISLHEGKNLDILTEACVLESFPNIRNNLKKIGWAYHICEILDGFCAERQENNKIFELAISTLHLLNKEDDIKSKEIIKKFEENLLKELGFWPKNKLLPDNLIDNLIESILEKHLKSKSFLRKI